MTNAERDACLKILWFYWEPRFIDKRTKKGEVGVAIITEEGKRILLKGATCEEGGGEEVKYITTHKAVPEQVAIADMPVGSLGFTTDGLCYYRTKEFAACLTSPGNSYQLAGNVTNITVILIPKGTQVTFEV
jgi:hypothetical protein